MKEWKETRLVPKEGTTHVMEGYENICETCENWGEACECCDIVVPLVSEFERKEVTMRMNTLCGVPIGNPYEVKENEHDI